MKKLLTILLFILTIYASGQKSVYYPFPDSNAVWNLGFNSGCMTGTDAESYSIVIGGDTLISSLLYHKLTTPFVDCYIAGSCTQTNFPGYKGAIRQDTSIRKVFYVPPDSSSEQLLYDFNMQVGDTVKGFIETWTYVKDTVCSIDSVLVGNNYHKRWFINPCYNIYFIEGVGSTYDLLLQSPGCVTDWSDGSITCFQQNGYTLYPDTLINCPLITSINTIDKNLNLIKVYPNPSNSSFTIDIDQSINVYEIRLTDLLGNIILRQQTNQQTRIKIDNIKSGTYILTAIGKDNLIINKRIISCL